MKKVSKGNGVVLEIKNMVVNALYSNDFDGKTRVSAHVSQDRVTTYPAQRMDSGFGDGLFDNPEGESFESTRHTLVPVPEGSTEESVATKLGEFDEATIYRVLSNNLDDVISDKERQAIANGLIEKSSLEPRYLVQDSDGNVFANVTVDGEILEDDDRIVGKIVKSEEGNSVEITNPNAILEYKRDIFSRTYREDVDSRVKANVAQQVEAPAHEEQNDLPA